MTPERWEQVKELFHSAIALETADRDLFLNQACGDDESLRQEIESLIASHEQTGSFIDSPAYQRDGGPLLEEGIEMKAGRQIGSYEIRSLLGRGGMGEVYLAFDKRLNRQVALKFLPASFITDAERLKRFEREARAASALNHPNIITIHEIGDVDSLHFIATEFVEGETLRERLSHAKLSLVETLHISIQIADALAAAHKAGIIHRDIKPENIMLRPDGYVKVLDFGLAKLAAPQSPGDSQAPTRPQFNTSPGAVVGTARYMSPEQARGLAVDERTDIWSLGVVVYEMVAGRAPFVGATVSDVIVAVLDRHPPPLTAQAAGETIPAKLEWIVEKALRKDQETRYQTIKDLRSDLSSLKQQLERESEQERSTPQARGEEPLTVAEGHASLVETKLLATHTGEAQTARATASDEALPAKIKQSRKGLLIALALGVLILAGIGFGIYKMVFQNRASSPLASFQTMKISKLTSVGKATDTAISPDGKYVVYVLDDAGQQSLWLRHVVTGSDKEIAAPAKLNYRGLVFSHDGDYLYFIGSGKDKESDGLYRVTVLGGDLRKLSGNVGSSASNITMVNSLALSPDDRRVAFALKPDAQSESALILMNTDGTGTRKLLTRRLPERTGEPGWSPDGKTIVCSVANISAGYSFTLIEVNVEDGKERLLSSQKWWSVGRIAWLRDGGGFVMTGADQPGGTSQIWYISYPDGKARRVTNDLNHYRNVSLTADSGALVAVQSDRQLNLSVAPNGDASRARQIMLGDNSIGNPSWTPDGRIIYSSIAGGKRAIWIMDADGKNQKQLTATADTSMSPSASSDGRYITFFAYSAGAYHIWRMDADGGNLKQLTDDSGHFPVITPDSKWVVYFVLTATGGQIRRVPIEGGVVVNVTDEKVNAIAPRLSPDGKLIACNYSSAEHPPTTPAAIFNTAIIPFAGGEPIKIFDLLGGPENFYGWTTDSRALTYTVTRGGVSNIWSQPIDGGKPAPLTNFTSEQIHSYDWSRDGHQLLVLRGTTSSDVVMLSDFK